MSEKRCEQLIAYFNGALSAEEEAKFEAHLQHCKECQDELKEWQHLTEDLPLLSEPLEPPAGMKKRVLDHVMHAEEREKNRIEAPRNNLDTTASTDNVQKRAEDSLPIAGNEQSHETKPVNFSGIGKKSSAKRRNGWLPWTLAACLLLSLLGNGYLLASNNRTVNQHISTPKVMDHVALHSDDADKNKSNGVALVLSAGEQKFMVIQADQLKPLSGKEVYTAWAIKGDKPVAIGTFKPDASGKGTMNYQYQGNEDKWDAVAVSLEPDATSTAPKGPIVMQSEL